VSAISCGIEVGCRYRWPNDGCHPDCWQPPLKGVVLEQKDPRAWKGTLAFPCRDGALPDAERVRCNSASGRSTGWPASTPR
jgi:hypothetical protein